jgi:hypothetical protein
MFDTAEWINNFENCAEKHLRGSIGNLSAKDAVDLGNKMAQLTPTGPISFKTPSLAFSWGGAASHMCSFRIDTAFAVAVQSVGA